MNAFLLDIYFISGCKAILQPQPLILLYGPRFIEV
jgi:hypothetical protein